MKWILRIVCRAWLVCGLGCLAIALGFGAYNAIFLFRAASAKGTIVSLHAVTNQQDGALNYAPVFSFTAEDGHTYTVMASVASNPPAFTVGQDIRVLYIKTNPAVAKLEQFWQLWFVTILCVGLGVLFSAAGYLLLRYERRRQQCIDLSTPSCHSLRLRSRLQIKVTQPEVLPKMPEIPKLPKLKT